MLTIAALAKKPTTLTVSLPEFESPGGHAPE